GKRKQCYQRRARGSVPHPNIDRTRQENFRSGCRVAGRALSPQSKAAFAFPSCRYHRAKTIWVGDQSLQDRKIRCNEIASLAAGKRQGARRPDPDRRKLLALVFPPAKIDSLRFRSE